MIHIILLASLYSAATVPGSGSDGFPVDNGRGQLELERVPGNYTVTVQDLDAGVQTYYTESKDFSVKGIICIIILYMINIMLNHIFPSLFTACNFEIGMIHNIHAYPIMYLVISIA